MGFSDCTSESQWTGLTHPIQMDTESPEKWSRSSVPRGEKTVKDGRSRQSLKDIAALARTRSVPVMMVIFPLLTDDLDNGYPFKAEHELVAKTAKENQMVVLDLFDEFRRNAPSELRQNPIDWEHPSAHGHLIAAEAIYKELVARALVPVWSCPD
jgi:hypothetical protein